MSRASAAGLPPRTTRQEAPSGGLQPLFEVCDLRVRMGACTVLNKLSFQLPQGGWTCIVGPNGAGKSTLLRALAGLLPFEAGGVRWMGRALMDWPAPERARQLAWLGQGAQVSENLTVAECVGLGRLPHQGLWAALTDDDRIIVQHALAQVGAQTWADRRMHSLSAGQRQRVLLARALAVQAPVLLLDEPTTCLDPPHQQEVVGLLRRWASEGLSVLSVLHDLSLALCADRVLVLGLEGRLVALGTPEEILAQDALSLAFEQTIEMLPHEGQWLWRPRVG